MLSNKQLCDIKKIPRHSQKKKRTNTEWLNWIRKKPIEFPQILICTTEKSLSSFNYYPALDE